MAQQKCAEIPVPKTLWTGHSALDIPKEALNGDVVVKATHGSGYVFPIFAGEYEFAELENNMKAWLRQAFGPPASIQTRSASGCPKNICRKIVIKLKMLPDNFVQGLIT